MTEPFLSAMQMPSIEAMSPQAYEEKGVWQSKGSFYFAGEELPNRAPTRFPFLRLSVGYSFSIRKESIFFNAAVASAAISMRNFNSKYRVKYVKIKHPDRWEFARIA